jgi:tetratricopeptide (TPR) repeat protein
MRLRPAHDPPTDAGLSRATVGVPSERLAEWTRAALLERPGDAGPDGPELHLHDATLVRALCNPDHPGLKPTKLRATLDRLRAWLPATGDPPRAITLVDAGGPLLVRLDDGTLADPNGQFRLDYGRATARPATLGRLGPPEPTTPQAWHARGVEQELAGDLPDAVDSYGRALLLGGPDVQLTFDLAHALAASGDRDGAIERYRQTVELDPLRQDAWVNLGDLLLAAGRTEQAIDALRRALDLDPDDPAAHYALADAFDLAAQPARAVPHWDAFLRLARRAPPAQAAYARARLGTHPAAPASH